MNRQIDVDELVTCLRVGLNTGLLPEVVEDVVELIGLDKTMQLVKAYGGIEMRVPVGKLGTEREKALIDAIGEQSARQFMSVYGGGRLYIPRCDVAYLAVRNLSLINEIKEAVSSGMSKTYAVQKIAIKYGVTERRAFWIIKNRSCCLDSCLDEQIDMFA